MIDKLLNFIRPTQSTIYDTESLTTLESIGKVIEKTNLCIQEFNNLEVKTTNDYNNFLNQITNYKNEIINIVNDIKNDNNSFKNEFREIIRALEEFNVTLEIINKQSKYIQDLAKINQDNIDKGTIATKDEIIKINTSLKEKANKNSVFSMANMGQDIREAMTGGSVAVIGKNTVLEENVVDAQITKRKTSFYKRSINLSHKSLEIKGKGINSNNGQIYDNADLVSTEEYINIDNIQYISVEKFKNGISAGTNEDIFLYFYDENKTFIKSVTLRVNNYIEVPQNSRYMRYQLMKANLYGFDLNLLPGKELKGFYIKEYDFEEMKEINKNFENLKNGNSIKDGAITPDKTSFFNIQANLFDSSSIEIGAILKQNGTLDTSFTTWKATDWIKVKANTTIYFSNNGVSYKTHLGALYDTNKKYLSPINDVTQIDVLEDGYIRVSQNGGFPDKYQIEVGKVTEYKEFNKPEIHLSEEYSTIKIDNNKDNKYENKKYLLLGDSITRLGNNEYGWEYHFRNIMKPSKVVNISVNGATWKDKQDTPTYDGNPTSGNNLNVIGNQVQKVINQKASGNTDYDNFDVIIIACGTNDGYDTNNPETDASIEAEFVTSYGADNFTIKPLQNVNRKTFAGIMRYTYEKLYELYPNAVFFVTTPLQEVYEPYKSIKAKGDLIDAIADRLSINTINTRRCGILNIYESPVNDIDYDNPTGSGSQRRRDLSDGIHTNSSGAKKLGEYIARDIINYFNF